jgi:hypothetical protein
MNLDANPTKQQLRELLARLDDGAGHHVLWVSKEGNVEVTPLAEGTSATTLQTLHPEMRLRYEAFLAGNEYVGPEAAEDDRWVSELFQSLLEEWQRANGKPGVEYIPLW